MNGFLQQFLRLVRRNPIVVASFVLVVCLGPADYFLWRRNADLTRHHDRVLQELLDAQLALSGHNRLVAQLATVEQAAKRIEDNLVVESDLAGNSDYFYQLEKTSGVRLSDLNQLNSQPAGDDNPYRAIPFSLRLSGSYPQLIAYLHGLEEGPRLLRIRRYSFARGITDGDNLALDLTVEMLGHP